MRLMKQITLTTALIICLLFPMSMESQNTSAPLQKLDAQVTAQEALNWAIQTISTYASVGVYRQKDGRINAGFAFFKGFKLDHADGCTLYLRNEGTYKANQKPYSCNVTIPIADLNPSSGKLFRYTSGKPDIDNLYGTWRVNFSTKDERSTARIYTKDAQPIDFSGTVVSFEFEDKVVAKVFEESFKRVIRTCGNK